MNYKNIFVASDVNQSIFSNGSTPASFYLFSFLSNINCTEKTVGFSWIGTCIVGVEGEHADHMTTTTASLCAD